jgi:hypothetical protein
MAGAIATSQIEAVREAALGFAFSPTPAVSSAALVAVSQQSCGGAVGNPRPWLHRAMVRGHKARLRWPNRGAASHWFACW